MPKVLTFEDREARLDEVKRAMHGSGDKRLYERYLCISLLPAGYSRKNITEYRSWSRHNRKLHSRVRRVEHGILQVVLAKKFVTYIGY